MEETEIMVRLLKTEKLECMMVLVKHKQNLRFYHMQLLLLLISVFHGKKSYSVSAQALTNDNLQYTG